MATVNENKLLRENSIKIVGKLMDAQVTTGQRKDNGQGYISVDTTVVSLINGVSNEFKVNFYTSQLTKDGKQSELYDSYSKLPEMVGRIGNQTAVANNDQITASMTNALLSALNQYDFGGGKSPTTIYIGNRKVYEGYGDYVADENDRYGTNTIKI